MVLSTGSKREIQTTLTQSTSDLTPTPLATGSQPRGVRKNGLLSSVNGFDTFDYLFTHAQFSNFIIVSKMSEAASSIVVCVVSMRISGFSGAS